MAGEGMVPWSGKRSIGVINDTRLNPERLAREEYPF